MKISFQTLALPALLIAATASLSACGGKGLSLPFGSFRVVNGISDSSSLDAKATNLPSDINNITVNTAAGFRSVPDGSFKLNLTVHSGNNQLGFSLDNVSISTNDETTAYFPGKITDGSYNTNGFQVKNPVGSIGTGMVEIQPVHAASNVPTAISLYINAPTDATITGTPINVAYKTGVTPSQISSGSYRLRVTAQGSTVVIFDSGTTGIPLAASARLQIAVLNQTDATGASLRIFLLLIPSDGSAPVAVANVLP